MAAVVVGAAAVHGLVDHAGFVDVNAAAHFEVELALGHRRHAQTLDDAGARGDLDTVADAGHRVAVLPKPARDAQQVLILPDVFRRATTTEKDARVFLRLDLREGDVGIDGLTLPLLRDRPARLDLMKHHPVLPLFRRGDDGLIAALDEAEKGIQRVHGLRGVADNDEDFSFGLGHAAV